MEPGLPENEVRQRDNNATMTSPTATTPSTAIPTNTHTGVPGRVGGRGRSREAMREAWVIEM
ncbi:hypothetical protein ITJ54_09640 [Curtobacterium sp. VKM Ac-2865]|uniref:hypothetical protein n=1 Tax=Curtobacterium sp. VKM Ac-2865 TaxID=2783817 RepID=UPI00188B8B2F|nr:hypothetical protein [Curtobacterium sp. VKM Ac-2865]MBF4582929.1 hypothetical protein [Curtobacterium sp. VKM Ac-2865]